MLGVSQFFHLRDDTGKLAFLSAFDEFVVINYKWNPEKKKDAGSCKSDSDALKCVQSNTNVCWLIITELILNGVWHVIAKLWGLTKQNRH